MANITIKMRLQSKYLLIVFILCFLFSSLQTTHSQNPPLVFSHLSVEDGLSQSTINVIYQDKMGFMWFGTDLGLNKYDGSSFIVYQHTATDSNSIASSFITSIFEDSYGVFWIGNGSGGLNRFDRENEIFIKYNYRPNQQGLISSNNIRAIFEDSRKNLWIGTAGGGLNLYDRHSDSFLHFNSDSLAPFGIGSNFVSSIAEDKDGYLWLGSPEGILTKFDVNTKKGKSFKLFEHYRADLYNTNLDKIYIDSDNNIWFGTEIGLYYYNQKTAAFQHFIKGNTNRNLKVNAVASVLEMEKGLYLIATDHGGINIYNKNTESFTYHLHSRFEETSISNDQLNTIYRSPDGIIWIGSFRGGINVFDPKAIKFKQSGNLVEASESPNGQNSVLTICEDKDNNIWVGNDGQGIDIINPKDYKIRHLQTEENNLNSIPGNIVTELYRDRKDNIWIGTFLEGMSKFDWKTKRYTHFKHDVKKPESIGGNNIWTILEDSEGIFWIGIMGNGLDRFDERTNTFSHHRFDPLDPTSLIDNDVFKVFEDNSGQIWVGTRGGLCLLDKSNNTFTRLLSGDDVVNGLYGNWVYDIYQDSFGSLWVGTDQALNLFNPDNNTFEHFTESEGLIGNAVLSIIGDKKNNLWISTNKGLCRFSITERKFRNFDVADGLQSNEFNYTSAISSFDGKLYFGGKNGFNVFNPDSIADNPRIPPVYFTKLKVLNTLIGPRQNTTILSSNINFAKSIKLTYKQSVISLEFAALNYSNPQKNQYAYMLEGFDEDWNYIGNKHEVTYTNLDAGRYLLKVKGSNNDGIWNEKGASLQIIILPPWWKSWWFKTIFYFSLISMLLLIYFLRDAFFRHQQQKLMVLVKERTFQLEEVAVRLEEKQEEINSQNEELMAQRDELEKSNDILVEQKMQILEQNRELDNHRNRLESLVEDRTRELMEAKDKAEESDKLKSSFLANLSHEIRTPLNAILGFSSLLGEKDISDQEREEYNGIIHGSSNNLLDLVSDILDISKIEAGQMELSLTAVSLEALISDLVGIFEMFMKRDDIGLNKQVQLKVAIDDELLKTKIITDNLRLTQVISNLVNNAIKFTKQGYIEVGCTKLRNDEMLEFYVKDTGIGIKDENLQLIFERFRKVEEDKSHLHRGTGLGLAISYQLVNLLGGSMHVTSTVGVGSVFYFTIPFIKSETPYSTVQRNNVTAVTPDYKKCSILVAEDDISNYNYIERLLIKANANVIHAVNGKQVLKLLQNHHDIKLILMDIKMPEMGGIETLHKIQKMSINIPVIAQTAYALADEVIKLKNEGFDEYISKPIHRENLYAIIDKLLNRDGETFYKH